MWPPFMLDLMLRFHGHVCVVCAVFFNSFFGGVFVPQVSYVGLYLVYLVMLLLCVSSWIILFGSYYFG